jgi:hypothetical protein
VWRRDQRAREDPGCDDRAQIVGEIVEERAEATGCVKQPGGEAVQSVGNRAERDVRRGVGQAAVFRSNERRRAEDDPEARDRLRYQSAHGRADYPT